MAPLASLIDPSMERYCDTVKVEAVVVAKVVLPVAVKAPEILVAAETFNVPDTLVVPVSVPSFIEVAMVEPLLPPLDTGT